MGVHTIASKLRILTQPTRRITTIPRVEGNLQGNIVNIKQLLIEKERTAYMDNKPDMAAFFDATLQYILSLEEQVNIKDAQIEMYQQDNELNSDG